tara:strand:- start:7388 stop:7540 length:153 start_codon:yes stop_codon:yes gene_type:complete
MTKKHFIDLAIVLKENKASKELIEDIMLVCNKYNSNFDREKFKDASGFYS